MGNEETHISNSTNDTQKYTSLSKGQEDAVCFCLTRTSRYLVFRSSTVTFKEGVLQGNLPLVVDCLGLGVDPNIEVYYGNSGLHIAAEKCDFSMLQLLLSRSDIIVDIRNYEGLTPLMISCMMNCREAVQIFLKNGADPNLGNVNGHRPLHFACEQKSMGIVFDLVAAGGEVNCKNVFDVSPLSIVVIDRPSLPIAKFLLRKGAKMHGNKDIPLFLECTCACVNREKLTMMKLLVHNGMDYHQIHPLENRNCYHYVAITGYAPLAEYLIVLNFENDLYVRDISGRTPMDLALDHYNYVIFHIFKVGFIQRYRSNMHLRKSQSKKDTSNEN